MPKMLKPLMIVKSHSNTYVPHKPSKRTSYVTLFFPLFLANWIMQFLNLHLLYSHRYQFIHLENK